MKNKLRLFNKRSFGFVLRSKGSYISIRKFVGFDRFSQFSSGGKFKFGGL